MSVELVKGWDRMGDVVELFGEYAGMLTRDYEDGGSCLKVQHYAEELQDLRRKYGEPTGRLYLALVDGMPAGCAALTRNDDAHGEMKRLYVRPAFRHLHVGETLARRIVEDARATGCRHVRLDTLASMEQAIRLYEKLGFRRVERYNDNPSAAAVFMQLDL